MSFNPCFNGTTSATLKNLFLKRFWGYVSILVLMELPLQLLYRVCTLNSLDASVSILVLMELPLQQILPLHLPQMVL